MSKPRVLYVAYLAPPVGGSRAQRVAAFSQELACRGWQVDLLTMQPAPGYPRRDDSLMQISHPLVRLIRTRPGFFHSKAFRGGVSRPRPEIRARRGRKVASWLIDRCLWPDRYLDWLPHAVRRGRELISKNDYAVILTSAAPFSGCLVGRLLASRARRPLVIDLGDPWTGRHGADGWRRWLDHRMENWVLSQTKSLIVTTQGTKDHYRREFPEFSAERIDVIPNGYWQRDFQDQGDVERRSGTQNILYAGTLYGHKVGLENFLSAFLRVRDRRIACRQEGLNFEFLGRDYIDRDSRLASYSGVMASGFVDASKACQIMKAASLLLLIGWNGGLQIPGKLWNYVGAGRPILTIPGRDDDELRSLMTSLNRGPVVGDDRESIEQGLEEILQAIDSGQESQRYSLGQIDDALWQNRTEAVDRLMHEIVDSGE